MASAPHIVDATPENFPELVLENSRKGPVFVNYRAPRTGPCLSSPLLEMIRRDRRRGDEVGRRGMLATFHILGPEHPLVRQCRGLLENALF